MSTHVMTDPPIQREYEETMRALGRVLSEFLEKQMGKPFGFALLVFPFGAGEDHRSNYISNADRDDMLAAMKEFIARAEGRYVE